MKNIEAITILNNLNSLNKFNTVYDVKFLFARQKNIRILSEIVKDFETTRDELFSKYINVSECETNEELNEKIQSNPELITKINELLNCKLDIELSKVDVHSLPETLTVEEFQMILPMVDE